MRVAFVGDGAIVLFDITAIEGIYRVTGYDRAGKTAKGKSVSEKCYSTLYFKQFGQSLDCQASADYFTVELEQD